ncbi:MAG: AMP-binding protein [Halobacteriales archaeon]|nr:AMP-binding protein [Halobacteriales archaeon]
MRDWLAIRAHATPARTALVDAASGESTSYGDLDDEVEHLAGQLAAFGVGVDDNLGVLAETRPAFVKLVHAANRLGAVLVPLNTRLTARELDAAIDSADVDFFVCTASTEATAVEAFDGPLATVDPPSEGARELSAIKPESFELGSWTRDCTAALLSTSGTTGGPKLVELTMGNLAASAAASSWRLGVLPDDCWYCILPMYHMGGLAPVYRSVLYGTSVAVSTGRFEPERSLAEMDRVGSTTTSLVPTMCRDLLAADEEDVLASLRFILVGGAPTPDSLVERAHAAGVSLYPSYGMTEASSQIATASPAQTQDALGTVGSPLMFTTVTIVGTDGVPVESGNAGEIVVSGATITPGYYGDSEATAEAFGPHGFHTGDAGYRDESGKLWILNRLTDRIITGGENVEPGEVAHVLRDHPDVEDAFVAGVPDDRFGQRVAALLVGPDSTDSVEQFARDRLAGFKIPRQWQLVETLPRTASGTVDRAAANRLLEDADGEASQ